MRAFLLTIIAICSLPVFAQHQLAIKMGNKSMLPGDHLAVKGYVVSKDTTVISAVNLEGDLNIYVPVQSAKISYDLDVILTRAGADLTCKTSGNFMAGSDTVLLIPSPVDRVAADHIIEKNGQQLIINTFIPRGYDRKKNYAHIFFLTGNEELPQYEKAWWQNMLDRNSQEVLLTRVYFNTGTDFPSLSNLSSLVADTLSRYIRSAYRILPGKDNFIIAGEGQGATIALATILDHEQVFGRSGMFLPVFNGLPGEMHSIAKVHAPSANGMFFFYTGSQENEADRKTSQQVMDDLGAGSRSLIYAVEDEPGFQSKGDWKKWFPEFYKWVFSNGLNYIIK